MSLITRIRKQYAVLWVRASREPDRRGGYTYANPIEISCRWEDTAMIYIKDGEQKTSMSVVYPDRALQPGDVLALGTLAALTGAGVATNPPPLGGGVAYEVQQIQNIPNLRANETLYKAFL